MTFAWKDGNDAPCVVDRVIVCSVNENIIGKLHYYQEVGYFAYFRDQQLNRSPLKSQQEARDLVQDGFAEWLSQRSAAHG